ncbi:serine/threonine-protein kinase [Aromatoleum diolicum]|uniref:Protein kinase n=1 Tax=Aromatoleum diolicum TaxID=75796 RepID=A0ABX1QJX5_9RHOO|nr:serine/threonine-protein kinase [Aromatoleum diolicum]NMG77650.1 protein kinase [Aromatoleum diolicum]
MVSPTSVPVAPAVDQRTMGRYVISAELGRGAMGTVYRAEDPLTERKVALKVFALDLLPADQADVRERVVRAAKAAGRLDHPNIVTIYDVGESSDGAPYIAMEVLTGLTLRDSLDSGIVFPLHKVIDVALLVLCGLDYAHQQGEVHGDITPAKIMLAHHGMVKIRDFGIALAVDTGEILDDRMHGSPTYLAPEQLTGGRVDARTDLFALGVTLYELLTGKHPFTGDSMEMALHNIVHLDPPSPATLNPEVPPELDRLVMQALAKEPAARFASAREMSRVLAPLCSMLDDSRGEARARSAPPSVLDGATLATPSAEPLAERLPSTGEAKRAKPSRWHELALLGGALIVLVAMLGRFMGRGDDTAPAPVPPPPLAAAPAAAELSAAAPVTAAPTVVPAPTPSEPEAAPPPTPTEPAVAAATVPAPARRDPAAPARGQLRLAVLPWGEVYVNGRRRGVTPPLRVLELPPGTYRIEIRNAGFPPSIQRVKIESGRSVSISYRFQ